jgi:hypothetical protein
MDAPDEQILLDLLRKLKPSDMSVLQASLQTPDSQIATVKGSANDALWSKLVEFGLANEMTLDVETPPSLPNFHPKSFALTDRGRVVIPALLKLLT